MVIYFQKCGATRAKKKNPKIQKTAKDGIQKKAEQRLVKDLPARTHRHPQALAENLVPRTTILTTTTMTEEAVEPKFLVVVLAVSVFYQARPAFPNGGHVLPSNLLLLLFSKK